MQSFWFPGRMVKKHQAPSSSIQRNIKSQAPNICGLDVLVFGFSLVPGAWSLALFAHFALELDDLRV